MLVTNKKQEVPVKREDIERLYIQVIRDLFDAIRVLGGGEGDNIQGLCLEGQEKRSLGGLPI